MTKEEESRAVAAIIEENSKRRSGIEQTFNPVTGEGSTFFKSRVRIKITDFPFSEQWIPKEMKSVPLIQKLVKAGSIRKFITDSLKSCYSENEKQKVIEQVVRVRIKFDYPFWAATLAYIKNKGGGEDTLFRLNNPQRKLIERLESMRLAGKPIRLILLKARQWGGSTCIQLYMAWLQLVHKVGLNSLIVAHQGTASDEIQDMFDRMISRYPVKYLHSISENYSEKEIKFKSVGKSGNIHRVPQRKCKIKIGTAERPDSARGGDYNLVHCSEVGLWKRTDGKRPQDIVRSACSGVLYRPLTMIIYESTANGSGNFFHREYEAAKTGKSQFDSMFVAWWQIPQYSLYISDPKELRDFAVKLWSNRENTNVNSDREVSGQYLWYLWTIGASLDAINWYIIERAAHDSDEDMASEFPSDDIEAFSHSGARVFDRYKVEKLRCSCKPPRFIGEVCANGDDGKEAFANIRFIDDKQGRLWIWSKPEIDRKIKIVDRYLVVVDIGGRAKKSDWSCIVVFDRLYQMEGGKPSVVAQWYGHIDMDLLAWKAAQIAAYYDNALLVIESNTLETHDAERQVDGDQSLYILNLVKDAYPNLYARPQSDEDIRKQMPRKYGFHTNVSTKPKIVSILVKVIREGLYTERDGRCLDEYLTYEKKPNGAWGAILGMHDDLLMTRGIGLLISFTEMEIPRIIEIEQQPNHKSSRWNNPTEAIIA